MKKTALILTMIASILTVYLIRTVVVAHYRFEKTYLHLWSLADKSSTIPAKQMFISKFVSALENGSANGDFAKNDAVWLTTPNNSFEANVTALKSLENRLIKIQDLDPNSFAYNTAIQQITAQEQGEAGAMIRVFNGCYDLKNFPMVWGWIGDILILLIIVLFAAALTLLTIDLC